MKIRTAFFAALAALPLLAGAASAHGGRDAGYHGRPSHGHDRGWQERAARRDWVEAQRAREWARRRHHMAEQRHYAPPRGYQQRW
ncbi:hypothetical protein ACFQS7_18075 [Dankookia sp. GCM10030260]|uniref:hypothetical protein n=1 Tax=Dankookia sp. GCM10030260 TaxID=3273390 RepID=UPI003606A785